MEPRSQDLLPTLPTCLAIRHAGPDSISYVGYTCYTLSHRIRAVPKSQIGLVKRSILDEFEQISLFSYKH